MWISIFTNIVLRLATAYGFVAIARSMGASVWTQERMVFLSMLVGGAVTAVLAFLVYKFGKWRNLRIMQFDHEGPGGPEIREA